MKASRRAELQLRPQAAPKSRPTPATAVLVAIVTGLAAGCGSPSTPAGPVQQTPRHLILVTIDTLRADRLGVYGNTTVPTPNFDRIAREGARAVDASAHVPITRPSHASLFTARYPADHGVRDNISLPLAKDVPTLAETLSAQRFCHRRVRLELRAVVTVGTGPRLRPLRGSLRRAAERRGGLAQPGAAPR